MPASLRPRWPLAILALAALGLIVGVSLLAAGSVQSDGPSEGSTVQGHVYDGNGATLEGANVHLGSTDGGWSANTTTDAEGAYRFDGVPEGQYDVYANHTCCEGARKHVNATADRAATVDLQLATEAPSGNDTASSSNGTVVLRGTVHDVETGEPVADARLFVENKHMVTSVEERNNTTRHERRMVVDRYNVTADEEGRYQVDVRPGEVNLRAGKPGFTGTSASIGIKANRTLDVPLRASSSETVTLEGVVRSDEGDPVADARVVVRGEDAVRDRSAERVEQDGAVFILHPPNEPFDSTRTDQAGRYQLTTIPGTLHLEAGREGHEETRHRLTIKTAGTHHANLTLVRIPGVSVDVHVTVVDAETGEPLPWASVEVRNYAWGHRNATITDENGTVELRTQPGYTIVTVRAPQEAGRPCPADRDASPEANGSITEATTSRPEPGHDDRCEPGQRERGYLPRSVTFVGTDGGEQALEVELTPRPEPEAVLEGWVVDTTSETGVPGARLTLVHEATGETRHARTDANGSFRVGLQAGYYTAHVSAEGYFPAVENLQLEPDENRTVALEVTPGEASRSCCVADHEPRRTAGNTTHAHDAGADTAPRAAGGSDSGGEGLEDADGGAEAADGGLGPYDPSRLDATGANGGEPGPSREAPAVGVLSTLALALLAGFTARARGR